MNRENQQQAENEAPSEESNAEEQAVNNNNYMFVIRGAYRQRVNQMVERLRNNFVNNVFGVGIISDTNNNNALRNQAGFNNLTRSLRLLNMIFPNRPILNVRIINVRSASTSATVGDILRNVENSQSPSSSTVAPSSSTPSSTSSNVENNESTLNADHIRQRDERMSQEESNENLQDEAASTSHVPYEKHANVTQAADNVDNKDILDRSQTTVINSSNDELQY